MSAKEWSWSYSKLKSYETCPKRCWHVDIARDVVEPESDQLREGNEVHRALELAVSRNDPLPPGMGHLVEWVQKLHTARAAGWKLYVEQKLAITRDFSPCGYFDKRCWFRAKADVLAVKGTAALAIDWKTGKMKPDAPQLALISACVFAHNPQIQKVQTEFVWLSEGERTPASYTRADMPAFWSDMLPRVGDLEQATKTTTFPAKPGRLCAMWCPVTDCPYHGQRL